MVASVYRLTPTVREAVEKILGAALIPAEEPSDDPQKEAVRLSVGTPLVTEATGTVNGVPVQARVEHSLQLRDPMAAAHRAAMQIRDQLDAHETALDAVEASTAAESVQDAGEIAPPPTEVEDPEGPPDMAGWAG